MEVVDLGCRVFIAGIFLVAVVGPFAEGQGPEAALGRPTPILLDAVTHLESAEQDPVRGDVEGPASFSAPGPEAETGAWVVPPPAKSQEPIAVEEAPALPAPCESDGAGESDGACPDGHKAKVRGKRDRARP